MIKFLITTALTYEGHHKYGNNDLINKREHQYRLFIEKIKLINFDKYYCECVSPGPHTFLNEFIDNEHLFYTKTHNSSLKNIGVDEINGCLAGLNHFNFDDNDIIIKLTGRYILNSLMLVNEIIEHEKNFDVFYHPFPNHHSGAGQVFTGAFGMRKRYYQNYLEQVDRSKMEREMINVEQDMLNYLHTNKDKIRLKSLDKLDITVYPGNGGDTWNV